jgi:glutamyl-tRNA reductase
MEQSCAMSYRAATIRPLREFEERRMYFSHSNDAIDGLDRNDEPVIARFRAALTSIRTKELDRLYNRLPELDERSRHEIGQFADCLVATILRPPLESLRDGAYDNSSPRLLDALQRLFQLAD